MKLPTRRQLTLPFMEVLRENGPMRSVDAAHALAEKLDLPPEITEATIPRKNGRIDNAYQRHVRWLRQDLVDAGFLNSSKDGPRWTLQEEGKKFLGKCERGVVVTVYETPFGRALWAMAEEAAAVIAPGSIQCIYTSSEYPLPKPKDYGNRIGIEWHNWFLSLARRWMNLLPDDGSFFLNLGQAYNPLEPTISEYQERMVLALIDELKYHYAGRFYWHNPSKPPAGKWVTKKRIRLTSKVEDLYWFSKTPFPKANNWNVLKPYEPHVQARIRSGSYVRGRRPSGHGGHPQSFTRDNGGAIPGNLIRCTQPASNEDYIRACKGSGLPPHPGRSPYQLPEMAIKLTTDPFDVVYDPLSGSNTTGYVAEKLQRYWISSELALQYIRGGSFRFPSVDWVTPDFAIGRDYQDPAWFRQKISLTPNLS